MAELELLVEIGELQRKYKQLCNRGGLTKRALCDLVIPFRDKYSLSDKDALAITRSEMDIYNITKVLQRSMEQEG